MDRVIGRDELNMVSNRVKREEVRKMVKYRRRR